MRCIHTTWRRWNKIKITRSIRESQNANITLMQEFLEVTNRLTTWFHTVFLNSYSKAFQLPASCVSQERS